jgi:hypothetical protein
VYQNPLNKPHTFLLLSPVSRSDTIISPNDEHSLLALTTTTYQHLAEVQSTSQCTTTATLSRNECLLYAKMQVNFRKYRHASLALTI